MYILKKIGHITNILHTQKDRAYNQHITYSKYRAYNQHITVCQKDRAYNQHITYSKR